MEKIMEISMVRESDILSWIEQRETTIRESVAKRINKKTGKPMQLSSSTAPRDWAKFQELQAMRKAINELSIKSKETTDFEEFSKQGVEARRERLQPFYAHILPIIAALISQGKTTSYAITNTLNAMGEKTARGKNFRPVQVGRLMKMLEERSDEFQLPLITDSEK